MLAGGWWVVAAAVLAASGAASWAVLQDTAPPGSLGSDGLCSSLTMDSDVWPSRPPDRELALPLVAGTIVTVVEGPGIWRALLTSDDAPFAARAGVPGHEPPIEWTDEYTLGWCRTEPRGTPFLARGNGTLHVRAWQGTGDGFSVG